MTHRIRIYVALALALCLVPMFMHPGSAQPSSLLAAQVLNGDFEGAFLPYGNGEVAQYWTAYDLSSPGGLPQFRRSTWILLHGAASQMFWKDHGLFHSGIMQVIKDSSSSSSSSGKLRIMAGRTITAHAWTYSVYVSPSADKQHGKILKRLGVDPYGGSNPQSPNIIWTDWSLNGQDKEWVRMDLQVEALASQVTLFIEAQNIEIGGQDQVFIDNVSIEDQGGPTATPTATRTPTPTPTPVIDVLRTISVGDQPKGIAVIPELNRFLVANSGADSVSRLDGIPGAHGSFDWRQSVFSSNGSRPSNVAADPDRCLAYVSNAGSSSVSVFNVCASTTQLVGSILLGDGKRPDGIAVLTTTNTIYVANVGSNSVSVINGSTLTVTQELPVGTQPAQVAANPLTNKIYVTSSGYRYENGGSVAVIDGNTQSVIKTLDLSLTAGKPAPEPYGVAINTVTNRVYVASGSGKMAVIDGASDQVLYVVDVPNDVGLSAAAVSPLSNNVFVGSAAGNTVFVYNANLGYWSQTLSLGAGQVGGLAVNPLTYHLMVSNTGQDKVSIVRDFGFYSTFRVYLPALIKPAN